MNKCIVVDNDSLSFYIELYDLNYIKYGVEQDQTYKILIAALHVIEAL